MWDRETPAITTMLRGLVRRGDHDHGADRDLHSGMYGGAARNPIHVLADILADLHDADGRVTAARLLRRRARSCRTQMRAQWDAPRLRRGGVPRRVGLSVPAGEKGR